MIFLLVFELLSIPIMVYSNIDVEQDKAAFAFDCLIGLDVYLITFNDLYVCTAFLVLFQGCLCPKAY